MTKTLFCKRAFLAQGWKNNVLITMDGQGKVSAVKTDQESPPTDSEHIQGLVLPGIANCHSHAFQRVMTGTAESRANEEDNFWSWRTQMYQWVERMNPDKLQAVATQLYLEMLKAGYTNVEHFADGLAGWQNAGYAFEGDAA